MFHYLALKFLPIVRTDGSLLAGMAARDRLSIKQYCHAQCVMWILDILSIQYCGKIPTLIGYNDRPPDAGLGLCGNPAVTYLDEGRRLFRFRRISADKKRPLSFERPLQAHKI
jgi:hypothetical protein